MKHLLIQALEFVSQSKKVIIIDNSTTISSPVLNELKYFLL